MDEPLVVFNCNVVVVFCGDVDMELLIDDVCGGVLEQFDETSVLFDSILFNFCVGGCPLIFADTGNVEADFIICVGIIENDNSCKPSNFSNSFGSLAPGKSCLFANIRIGTPCVCVCACMEEIK